MNNFTDKTYNDLIQLVKEDEFFHFKDFTLKDNVYRIFNYRLASWTSFSKPGALNCRGIMFDITNENEIKLVSLPPEKFFNYEEGGVNHTLGKLGDKMDKMDGSLISTYLHENELFLKSKASLFSSQAVDSMRILNSDENKEMKEQLTRLVKDGYTVNMEYTSPANHIVVRYEDEKLTILSVRSHENGENFFASKLEKLLKEKGGFELLLDRLVSYQDLRSVTVTHDNFVTEVRSEKVGEGYVVEIVVNETDSYLVKIKNLNYIDLHRTKDSVNSPRRLFEVVINEASDDLRSMFADDPYVLNEITQMENKVQPIFNRIVHTVESFYEQNKDLSRKEFALKATSEKPGLSGLIMNLYVNEKVASGEIIPRPNKDGAPYSAIDNDYKAFAIKHRKDLFGIGDDELELDENGNILRNKIATSLS